MKKIKSISSNFLFDPREDPITPLALKDNKEDLLILAEDSPEDIFTEDALVGQEGLPVMQNENTINLVELEKDSSISFPAGNTSVDIELKEYIKKVFLIPNLSKEQEEELMKSYFEEKNKESGQQIIASHLKLVVKLSFRYRRYTSSLFDLISEGNLGLMYALKKFKPSKGIKFATYAVFWVRDYIQNHIRKNWSIVYGKTKELKRKLFSKQESNAEYSKIEKINYYTENFTEKENSVEQIESGGDFVEEFFQKNKEDIQKKAIKDAIAQLDERAAFILQERFLKEKKSTLSDLSEKLKISKERIRQIEEKSIDFIKKFVKEECESNKI